MLVHEPDAPPASGIGERLALPQAHGSIAQAVAGDELRLLYQPIVRVTDGAIAAIEALVRWQHPTLGLITPDRFLPACERDGHSPLLDGWVLRRAARDMVELNASLGDAAPEHLNVNLAAAILESDVTGLVTAALEHTGLAARRLVLELSEGSDLDAVTAAWPRLQGLIDRGVHVALDDMGAGSTDLRYLSRLAISGIKIDRGFVAGIPHNHRDHAIVSFLSDLARRLRLYVTAEGVETAEQLAALARVGVPYVQGYHLAPPLTFATLATTLRAA